jgi:hypothetical protein
MAEKAKQEQHIHHQTHHDYMRGALPVHVARDSKGRVTGYEDLFGEEGTVNYNLYRGSSRGEGHADRILDHYLGCHKLGFPIHCSFSEEYQEFLRKESNYEDARPPPLSLRARLMQGGKPP